MLYKICFAILRAYNEPELAFPDNAQLDELPFNKFYSHPNYNSRANNNSRAFNNSSQVICIFSNLIWSITNLDRKNLRAYNKPECVNFKSI
jgi:hypothetical protein